MISQVKLIAEPWDVGHGGYQVGNFPPLWTEWNGKYRDTVRDFWRGDAFRAAGVRLPADRLGRPVRHLRPPARRLDQLRHLPRRVHPHRPGVLRPQAQRGQRRGQPRRHRRQPLLELRRRGPDRGSGDRPAAPAASGATSWPRCSCRRACRCCSHGDELGRTQRGNNNAYCQDNEISWVDWSHAAHRGRPAGRSSGCCRSCGASTRSSSAAGSSTAAIPTTASATSSGSPPAARR